MVQCDPVATIDLSNFQTRKAEITQQLMTAASDIGFFRVKGHGMNLGDIQSAHAMSLRCLDLPDEVKGSLPMNKENFAYILGWSEEHMTAGRLREGMMIGFDNDRMKNLWPAESDVPEYKAYMVGFMRKCHQVTERIMSCFATGLGLPEDYFKEVMNPDAPDNQTAMCCNRYPSVEGRRFPEGALRSVAHTDFELLTLLFTRPGEVGLEVCAGKGTTAQEAMKSGMWHPCDPVEGTITINIGDALQYWSDDRLKSTFHRVRIPRGNEYKGDRHSMAYFANAGASTRLQGPQKKYPPITFPEILAEKQRQTEDADFDKMNDEQKTEFMTTKALGPEMEYLVEDHKDASGDAIITPKDPKGALLDAMQNLAVGS